MKKIPTLFKRNPNDRSRVLSEFCFSFENERKNDFSFHRKYDGACCAWMDNRFYKRRCVKREQDAPNGYIPVDFDDKTKKSYGWVPVKPDAPEDVYFIEAMKRKGTLKNGTYELVGPKVNGNPEKFDKHTLIHHVYDTETYNDVPLGYDELKNWFMGKDIEGLVIGSPGARYSFLYKIKKKDFGLKRGD